MSTAIRVENLSKKYIIGHEKQERYTALRDVMANWLKNVFKRNSKETGSYTEEFYALKDVSFDIQQGDRIGIIGRNGAGKSTLLKVMSRITEPTSGKISIKGRVASLLEVGTGFHPELTGRENIYLNGAILGMSMVEIRKKFDEIVAFSEVERFLDTPVKHYSSGMYVRLAFAVAAHLEPEILIVDEVLAVGDAQFQKKCLGKMEDVSLNEGRTVLFVSHNIGAIKTLCTKGILLNKGSLIQIANIDATLISYSKISAGTSTFGSATFSGRLKENLLYEKLFINGVDSDTANIVISPAARLEIKVLTRSLKKLNLKSTLSIFKDGIRLFSLHDVEAFGEVPCGIFESTYLIPSFFLRPGIYSIALGAKIDSDNGDWIWGTDILLFEIIEEKTLKFNAYGQGIINPPFSSERVILDKVLY